MQWRIAQTLAHLCKPGPLLRVELARAQPGLINPSNRTGHTNSQLLRAHFHGEHGHWQAFLQGDVLCNVDGQSRFTHAGTSSQNNQIARLET